MKDNRLQRAKINAATMLINQLVSTVCGMIIPWIMIDTFGSVAYGATTSIAQFLSYISLFEGGIGRVARGALYKPLAEKDNNEISKVYHAIKRFFRTIGIAFFGYTLVLAMFYHDIADVTVFSRQYIFSLVIIISLGKLAEYMGGISNITLYNADQKQYIVNSVTVITNIINALLVLVLASIGCDILVVKLVGSLIFITRPIIYTIYLKKNYNIVNIKEKVKLNNKWTGLGQHMAYFLQNNTDVFLLTIFADLRYVAIYSVYHLVIFSIRNITTSFTGGMEAVFGDMIAKKEEENLNNTYERYKLLLTIITITLFGVAGILIVPFVKIYTAGVTDANYEQPIFALILMLSDAINCLILPCFNLPIAANKLKESRVGAYGEAVVNLVLSTILIFWNPLIGIAIGTLASAIFKSIYYMRFCAKHILKQKVGKIYRDFAISLLTLFGVAVIGMDIISNFTIKNYFDWGLLGIICVIVVGIIALAVSSLLYPRKIKKYIPVIFRKG